MDTGRAERIAVFLAVALIPAAARLPADAMWSFVSPLDPDRAFLWITMHHVAQLALTLLVLRLVFHLPPREAGFNLSNLHVSLKSVARFALVYALWVTAVHAGDIMQGTTPFFAYPLTDTNMTGVLSFQLLLSGGAEEPLFRGLVMGVLGRYWTKVYRVGLVEMPVTGLVATALFMFAHLNWTASAPYVSASAYQQLLSLGLGLYYAALFHRTKSLVGPIIAHGCSNVIAVGGLYLLALW